jgi:multiple sugar transport system ATP-binding protein
VATVQFDRVSKRFGADVLAVSELDLDVAEGEFLILVGPSGCGKTTALRMVAGLEEVTSGEIRIGGRLVNDLPPTDRDVAMVFQNYALYPHMTVRANIAFPLHQQKVEKHELERRVGQVASLLGIEDLLERRPRALSGGQRQRVAIGRALVRRPQAFLMDEPLSNLDAKLRVQMRAELKHLQHELQVTTIYVTHDQIEAMTLAHRVAVMNRGMIEQLGTPKEIYNDPRTLFVAGFIGSPPMNLIVGEARDGVFTGAGGLRVEGLGRATAARAVLGVRPEDAHAIGASEAGANLTAPIYSAELTGESTLVSVHAGDQLVTMRADKNFVGDFDQMIGVRMSPERVFLFDQATDRRIDFTSASLQ